MANGTIKTGAWTDIPVTFQVTTGNTTGVSMKFQTDGKFLKVEITGMGRSVTTAAGQNAFAANIQGLPAFERTILCSYLSASGFFCDLKYGSPDATITARVIGAAYDSTTYTFNCNGVTPLS